jgi:hypothetical protein
MKYVAHPDLSGAGPLERKDILRCYLRCAKYLVKTETTHRGR